VVGLYRGVLLRQLVSWVSSLAPFPHLVTLLYIKGDEKSMYKLHKFRDKGLCKMTDKNLLTKWLGCGKMVKRAVPVRHRRVKKSPYNRGIKEITLFSF